MATILCIDDKEQVLELHRAVLESNGYRVLTAIDALTGITLARTESTDVVVLDFNMPGLDGNEVAEMMLKQHPSVAVVICSDYPDQIPEPLRWFADALVRKDDSPKALLSALARLVKPGAAQMKMAIQRTTGAKERLSA